MTYNKQEPDKCAKRNKGYRTQTASVTIGSLLGLERRTDRTTCAERSQLLKGGNKLDLQKKRSTY